MMDFIDTREMKQDLQEVDQAFESSLAPWWNEIELYMPRINEDPGMKILPAIVLAAYKSIGLSRELALQMANLFKILLLANRIHLLIQDDEEGQQHNQDLQFVILIGDYIFGKVLRLLLDTDAERLLDMFAVMIGDINEGHIMQFKLNGTREEVLAKTRAPLYQNAFGSAAQLDGWPEEKAELYGGVGRDLGMALELTCIYQEKRLGKDYLDSCKIGLEALYSDIQYKDAIESIWTSIYRENGGADNGV
jgi:geranylgeranyl pyrophosphate synthase